MRGEPRADGLSLSLCPTTSALMSEYMFPASPLPPATHSPLGSTSAHGPRGAKPSCRRGGAEWHWARDQARAHLSRESSTGHKAQTRAAESRGRNGSRGCENATDEAHHPRTVGGGAVTSHQGWARTPCMVRSLSKTLVGLVSLKFSTDIRAAPAVIIGRRMNLIVLGV